MALLLGEAWIRNWRIFFSFLLLYVVTRNSYTSDMQLTQVSNEFVSNCKNKSMGISELEAIFALSPNKTIKSGQAYWMSPFIVT